MPRRLVGIAVIDKWISPMMKAHGHESGTCVKGLGEGEELVMKVHTDGVGDPKIIHLREGVHPLPSPLARGTSFLIEKMRGGISATTVEVILG